MSPLETPQAVTKQELPQTVATATDGDDLGAPDVTAKSPSRDQNPAPVSRVLNPALSVENLTKPTPGKDENGNGLKAVNANQATSGQQGQKGTPDSPNMSRGE